MIDLPPVHPIEDEAWKSYFVLSPHDREELIGIRIVCSMALLDVLLHKIDYRSAVLEQIHNETQPLVSRIEKLDSAIASYRKLPPEILSRIFELSREGGLQLPPGSWKIATRPPPKLPECSVKQVCARWRDIASRTPAIVQDSWDKVTIDYSLIPELEYDGPWSDQLDFLTSIREISNYAKVVLDRGTRSLVLTITSPSDSGYYWQNEMPYHMLLNSLFVPSLPQLEDLEIINEEASQEFMDSFACILPTLPSLKSLRVEFSLLSDPEQFLPLPPGPLGNLTDLRIEMTEGSVYLSDEGTYVLLSLCPQLQECSILMGCDDHLPLASQASDSILTLQSLRSFMFYRSQICEHAPVVCNPLSLLRRLNLPLLQTLDIEADHIQDATEIIQSFTERSQCRLQKLSLSAVDKDEKGSGLDWDVLFPESLSSLTKLYAPDETIPSEILRKVGSEEYLPLLKNLKCEVIAIDDSCKVVEKLLRSRLIAAGYDEARLKYRGAVFTVPWYDKE